MIKKKICFIFLFLFLSFIPLLVVSAEEKFTCQTDERFLMDVGNGGAKMPGNYSYCWCEDRDYMSLDSDTSCKTRCYSLHAYEYVDSENQYSSFCLDPQKVGPGHGEGKKSVTYCKSRIMNVDEDPYDRGIVKIYQLYNGGNDGYSFLETQVAVRLFTAYVGNDIVNADGNDNSKAGQIYMVDTNNFPIYRISMAAAAVAIGAQNSKSSEYYGYFNNAAFYSSLYPFNNQTDIFHWFPARNWDKNTYSPNGFSVSSDLKPYMLGLIYSDYKTLGNKSDASIANVLKLFDAAVKADKNDVKANSLKVEIDTSKRTEVKEENGTFVAYFNVKISGMNSVDGTVSNAKLIKDGSFYDTIEFLHPELVSGNLKASGNDATTIEVKATISRSNLLNNQYSAFEAQFKLSLDYVDSKGSSNVFVACPVADGTNTCDYSSDAYQRLLMFSRNPKNGNESYDLKVEIKLPPKCSIVTNTDGTKTYYGPDHFKIDLGSEELNYAQYAAVCNLRCFEDERLTPGSDKFDAELFISDQYNCCNELDRDDPDDAAIWDTYCKPPELTRPCAPMITSPSCTDSGTTQYIEESDDFDRCIFNNEDQAGNTYNISDVGYDNPYCQVACKEDYEIKMPGSIDNVRAGNYFVLSTSLKGTRTCKSTTINQDKFSRDLGAYSAEVVEKYNAYIRLKKMDEASFTTVKKKEMQLVGTTYQEVEVDDYSEATYNSGCYREPCSPAPCTGSCSSRSTKTCKTLKKEKNFTYPIYDTATGDLLEAEHSETVGPYGTAGGSDCECGGSGAKCNNTSAEAAYEEEYGGDWEAAYREYRTALQKLENAKNYYRTCSSWNNNYEFEPDITYSYDEDYYMNNLIGSNNRFVEAEDSRTSSLNEEFCSGTSCSVTSYTKSYTYPTCNNSGCHSTTEVFPANMRVNKTASISASYKPATVFYTMQSTGAMATRKVANNYTRVGRVFPVRMTTPEGRYQYTLNYRNIGQYNDNNRLGRLTGASSYNGRTSVFETLGYSNEFVCYYGVYEDICEVCPPPTDGPEGGPGGGTNPGGITYFYRPISLYDVFPNSLNDTSGKHYLSEYRSPGRNWLTNKGAYTQQVIERNNADAYKESEYSFTLTPANMQAIREYNKTHKYNDFTLVCNDEGYDCISTFLRDGNGVYFTDAKLNEEFIHVNESGAPTGTVCQIGQNNSASCVGPSWK